MTPCGFEDCRAQRQHLARELRSDIWVNRWPWRTLVCWTLPKRTVQTGLFDD
jgi:hypothetical protein